MRIITEDISFEDLENARPPKPSWLNTPALEDDNNTIAYYDEKYTEAMTSSKTAISFADDYIHDTLLNNNSIDNGEKMQLAWLQYAVMLKDEYSHHAAYQLTLRILVHAKQRSQIHIINSMRYSVNDLHYYVIDYEYNLERGYISKDDANYFVRSAIHLLNYNVANEEDFNKIRSMVAVKKLETHEKYEELNELILSRLVGSESKLENVSNYRLVKTPIKKENYNDWRPPEYLKNAHMPMPLVDLVKPELIRDTLNAEFPWFAKLTEFVYEQMIMQLYSIQPTFKLRPLLIDGVAGVGKTSWVNRLAELVNTESRLVACGGSSDSMLLRGTPMGWSSTRPSFVVQEIARSRKGNPIFILDEIDKASPDARNGRIWDVILQMIEPGTSNNFLDECLQVGCDLSEVSWIATSNFKDNLPGPLRSRFDIFEVEQPSEDHAEIIIANCLSRIAKKQKDMIPDLTLDDIEVLKRLRIPRHIDKECKRIIAKKMVMQHLAPKH